MFCLLRKINKIITDILNWRFYVSSEFYNSIYIPNCVRRRKEWGRVSISTYLYPIIAAHVLPAVAVFYDATWNLGQGKVCVYALRAEEKFSLL